MGKESSGKRQFIRHPIGSFLKNLGSDSVSPGGGAAAALAGALGVSLVEMVLRINEKRWLRKQGEALTFGAFREKILALEKIRGRLGELMRLDTEAYLQLSQVPKEKREGRKYESTLKHAAGVPLEICELAIQTFEIAQSEIYRTSRWLASDLAEAGILLEASFRSGRLNAEVNLRSIQNKTYLKRTKAHLNGLEKKMAVLNKKISMVLKHD